MGYTIQNKAIGTAPAIDITNSKNGKAIATTTSAPDTKDRITNRLHVNAIN